MAKDKDWLGFSNIPLSDANKQAIKKLKWTKEEAFLYIEAMATEGYKVTITQDLENGEAFTVSATGRAENTGMTMTQRHSDLVIACAAHYYAHKEVANSMWPDPVQPLFDTNW